MEKKDFYGERNRRLKLFSNVHDRRGQKRRRTADKSEDDAAEVAKDKPEDPKATAKEKPEGKAETKAHGA